MPILTTMRLRRPHAFHAAARETLSTVAFVCCGLSWLVQTACTVPEVQAGGVIQTQTGAGRHTYRVRLLAGQSVRVLLQQHDADLALTVAPPDGQPRPAVDARERDVESATIVADESGTFTIGVRIAHPGVPGTPYELQLEAPAHPTTPRDLLQQRAETLASEGKQLASDPGADAQRLALDRFAASLAISRGLDDAAAEAAMLAMMGDLLQSRSAFADAEARYLDALTLSRQRGDRHQVGELLNNLGVVNWRRGLLRDAMRYFEQALELWRSLPLQSGEAATLTNEGNLFYESSDYQQALDRFVAALKIFQAQSDARGEAYALNNIGVTYRALGDLDAALTYANRALPRFRAAGEELAEGRGLVRLAQIHLARGDPQTAKATAEKALPVIRRADDRLAEADVLDLFGQIAFVTGDTRGALRFHHQALTRYRDSGSRRGEAAALHHIGAVRASAGQNVSALEPLERALAIRHDAGLRDAEAETLHQIALVEWQAGDLSQAHSRLRTALALTEDVRGRVAGEYSRTTYFAARQKYFAAAIDLLMVLHERDPSGSFDAEAFEISERERARSLLDLLEESRTDIRRGVDPLLLQRERELQQQLDFWSYRLAALIDRKDAEAEAGHVREKIGELVGDYRETEARIRAASAAYANLAKPPLLTLEQVQRQVLDSETMLLRFVLGERRSYVWALTPQSLKVAVLPAKAEIEAAARRVYALVSEKRLSSNGAQLLDEYRREAKKLSAMLLAPLAGDFKPRRLLIICDGALQFVPFAALPEPFASVPLVTRHEIVMLPSASTLAVLRRQTAGHSPASKTIAVLADPVYEASDPRVPRHATARAVERLAFSPSRLPFSRFEGESILSLVPASQRYAAFGFAASVETATSRVLQNYRIVHFAAHAIADQIHPELSGIVLSLVDPKGVPQSGLLRLHDIFDASLRADLVVLSACQTAIGKDVPGEGVMGLARAFFSAGAARVVASQFKVEDEATAELMRAFYRAMLGPDRLSPSAALRAAQMTLLNDTRWRDPHWWSAFVIIGEPR
jgi:CHAT domain-containing protein/Tfp pilus assembly protein PilF